MNTARFKGILIPVFIISISLSCAQGKKSKKVNLENESDSLSYALAIWAANNAKQSGFDQLDPDVVATAINDWNEDKTKISAQESAQILQAAAGKAQAAKAEKEKAAGIEFLAENGKKEGITTTASGLQYEILTEGSGAKPLASNKVKVHYHGTLIDGTVFDSSKDRGQPAEFGLGQVIKGWTEGLQLMAVGSKFKFYIPQELGYGARAQGSIPAYSTLIFEVELLDIVE